MPIPSERPTPTEQKQAYIEGFNDQSEDTKIISIESDKTTNKTFIILEMSPEQAAKVKQSASIHLHNPEDTSSKHRLTISGKEQEVRFIEAGEIPPGKNWSAAERKRRAKAALDKTSSKDVPRS